MIQNPSTKNRAVKTKIKYWREHKLQVLCRGVCVCLVLRWVGGGSCCREKSKTGAGKHCITTLACFEIPIFHKRRLEVNQSHVERRKEIRILFTKSHRSLCQRRNQAHTRISRTQTRGANAKGSGLLRLLVVLPQTKHACNSSSCCDPSSRSFSRAVQH